MEPIINANENSHVVSGSYDPSTRIAEVTFKGKEINRKYTYAEVPEDLGYKLVESLKDAESSTGTFVRQHLARKFETTSH